MEIIETLAHNGMERPKDKSMGGRVWWKEMEIKGDYRLQQNLISQHYRILDGKNYRWYSSFEEEEEEEAFIRFYELCLDEIENSKRRT